MAVVVPTLYEAGSFPLIESILMGIPVICSNVTSLPGTIGNEKFIFNPYDIEEMALMIERICFDIRYRELNIKNSTIRSKKLKNDNAAIKIENIYKNLLCSSKNTAE